MCYINKDALPITVNVYYTVKWKHIFNVLVGAVDLIDELMSSDGKYLKSLTNFINE